jgi:hypothetical protein
LRTRGGEETPVADARDWPSLPLESWKDTYETLHLWLQIVGKIRLALSPFENHWWHVALYVSPRGLRTSPVPRQGGTFEIELDFLAHTLFVETDDGRTRELLLFSRTVADFYDELFACLASLGITPRIGRKPQEIPEPTIPFDEDRTHATYDPSSVRKLFRILVHTDRVFKRFHGEFQGKSSPVHFFWGSFDLCTTRFSGKRAPEKPGADLITRLGYSHEVVSVGFWPGSGNVQEPAFYAYAAPEPAGFDHARVSPSTAFYNPATKGWVLRYEDVRRSPDPERAILDFCRSTYEAGAVLGGWDREALDRRVASPVRSVA